MSMPLGHEPAPVSERSGHDYAHPERPMSGNEDYSRGRLRTAVLHCVSAPDPA
jgi:hypothetical protein